MDNIVGFSNVKVNSSANSIEKSTNCNFIFYIGLLLLPFDNLFFAPSSGWAAIAPFLFLFYALINFRIDRQLFSKPLFIFGFLVFIIAFFRGFASGLSSNLQSLGTLILGISFYYSLIIFYEANKDKKKILCYCLLVAYSIAYLYGIISLIPSSSLENFFLLIEKRHYTRLQYTFTEPSFISMHIFGVLLPFGLIFRDKKIIILSILFIITTLIFGESARFYIDTIIIGVIFFTYYFARKKRFFLLAIFYILFILLAYLIINGDPNSNRLSYIIQKGLYADNSLAARYFRINAIMQGMDTEGYLYGYGLSNTWIPFNNGYASAYKVLTNTYMGEIDSLYGTTGSSFYCMPIRILAEFGLPILCILLIKLFDKKTIVFFIIILYLYIQFDSYAFYTIWIYLFLVREKKNDIGYSGLL